MRNILALTLAALTLVLTLAIAGCDGGSSWNKVAEDDPNLEAARQRARDSYPEFLKAIKSRKPMDLYTVEVHYQGAEYVSLSVLKATETEIVGIVDNYPQKVSLKKGEQVTIQLGDMSVLSDWAIDKEDGESQGGFVAAEKVRLSGRGG